MRCFQWLSGVVCALVVSNATSTQAGLVSLFEFNEGSGTATSNVIGTAPNGTLKNGATFDTGVIGTALKTTASTANGKYSSQYQSVELNSGAYPKTEPWGSYNNAVWKGTFSFWIKITSTSGSPQPEFFGNLGGATNTSTGTHSWTVGCYGNFANSPETYIKDRIVFMVRPNTSSPDSGFTLRSDATPTWYDGNFHLITASYQATTGAAGTGSGTFYLDGVAQTTSTLHNGLTSAGVMGAWGKGRIAADVSEEPACNPGYIVGGLTDDFGIWNNQLSATEVKALYNLAVSPLNYGAKNTQALLDLYSNGGTALVDGKTWQKVTGLTGTPGTVGSDFVVLGSGGAGVQIVPEPGTLCLLLAARWDCCCASVGADARKAIRVHIGE